VHGSEAPFEVDLRRDVEYAVHDGQHLVGDLYRPRRHEPTPVVVAVHGGAWGGGSPAHYRYWGPYLAARGVAVFAIQYRLVTMGSPTYPQAVHDVRAAVQFARGDAAELGLDPNRIALIGDSAGGHLASFVALAGDDPRFCGASDGPHVMVSTQVKAVVSFYGVYDLLAQWHHDDLLFRMRDYRGVEKFLGRSPIDDRRIYFEASPLSYATTRPDPPAFLLVWGAEDDIVDPTTQAAPFRDALRRAMYYVRTVVIPGAGHFWITEPIEEPSSYTGVLAPRLLRFLDERL
jgi:acetyl esterase/lipase